MLESNQIRGVRFAADAMNINHAAHPLRFRESHRGIVRLSGTGSMMGATCHKMGDWLAIGVSRNLGCHSRNSVSRRPSSSAHRTLSFRFQNETLRLS
jgi:hypothetical protein